MTVGLLQHRGNAVIDEICVHRARKARIRDFTSCPNNDIEWEKIDLKIIARILY
jgi:hypothetical protein